MKVASNLYGGEWALNVYGLAGELTRSDTVLNNPGWHTFSYCGQLLN